MTVSVLPACSDATEIFSHAELVPMIAVDVLVGGGRATLVEAHQMLGGHNPSLYGEVSPTALTARLELTMS